MTPTSTDDEHNEGATVWQPLWSDPTLACCVVLFGLGIHFLISR